MLLKSDVMNPYKLEAVSVKEAVQEAFRISSLGYSSPTELVVDHTQKMEEMFATLLEVLHIKKSIDELDIVVILATHTITKELQW